MSAFTLETYDVATGRRIQAYDSCGGESVEDACAILADELRDYPEYLARTRSFREWSVRELPDAPEEAEPIDDSCWVWNDIGFTGTGAKQ